MAAKKKKSALVKCNCRLFFLGGEPSLAGAALFGNYLGFASSYTCPFWAVRSFFWVFFFEAHSRTPGQTPPAPSFSRKHICSRFIPPASAASENERELMQCGTQGRRRKWKGRASCLTPPTPPPPRPAASPVWPSRQLSTGLFLSRLQLRL